MTTSHWLRPYNYQAPDYSTDVLIVGAGYVGLSAAYWLTEMKPGLKVTIIDRSTYGAGASSRNAGFLTMGSAAFYKSLSQKWGNEKALLIHQFARESLQLAYEHVLKNSSDIDYVESSAMTLFQTQDQFNEWGKADFNPDHLGFHWKKREELPASLQKNFYGAYEMGPEYKINPIHLLAAIRKILEKRNVRIIENEAAFNITDAGVLTETAIIKAKQVVLALNGYFPQFNKVFDQIIVPRRAQMVAVEVEESFDCPSLYYDPAERAYWRKTGPKTMMVGGKRLLDELGETGDFEKISPKIQEGLELYIKERLGIQYRVINRWSGTMAFTEHELPYAGKLNSPVESYMIGGFSGHGMGLGFRSGKDMAELLTGQKQHSFYDQFKKINFSL